jgi:hypothetical protein
MDYGKQCDFIFDKKKDIDDKNWTLVTPRQDL